VDRQRTRGGIAPTAPQRGRKKEEKRKKKKRVIIVTGEWDWKLTYAMEHKTATRMSRLNLGIDTWRIFTQTHQKDKSHTLTIKKKGGKMHRLKCRDGSRPSQRTGGGAGLIKKQKA